MCVCIHGGGNEVEFDKPQLCPVVLEGMVHGEDRCY